MLNNSLNKKRKREKSNDTKQNLPCEIKEKQSINDKNNFDIDFKSNPNNFKFLKNLIKNECPYKNLKNSYDFDNTFIVFKSINDILCLIYSNRKNYSIISYNMNDNKKIIEVKNSDCYNITEFSHYVDIDNKRDLIISISAWIYNIKVWDFNNFECLYHFQNDKESVDDDLFFKSDSFLYSACLISVNKNIFIIIGKSNIIYDEKEHPIKVFDLNGNLIKKINNSNEGSDFIATYYEKITSKYYIK